MSRYLSLISFTDAGIRAINDSVGRADAFKQAVEAAGGTVQAMYWAVGSIDGAVIFEAPDEGTAASLVLHLSHDGFVRTNTMRVFDQTEIGAIVGSP